MSLESDVSFDYYYMKIQGKQECGMRCQLALCLVVIEAHRFIWR